MENVYYIGLDIHKKMIVWRLKDHSGCFVKQGDALRSARVGGGFAAALGGGHGGDAFSPGGYTIFFLRLLKNSR